MSATRPKVSVLMLTYNHAAYVEQAIESVLMQRTSFPYEVVVADDCSTDDTQSVLRRFAEQRQDVIRPILREANVGVKQNFQRALEQCHGDYVAILEGDDYWIDEYKLQKQVDFMEANPEYVLVGGNAIVLREKAESNGASHLVVNRTDSLDISTADFVLQFHMPPLTMLFRNHIVSEFPLERFKSILGGDRIIYITLSLHGKCRFMNQVLGVYRVHDGGVTHLYKNSLKGQIRRHQDLFFFAEELHTFLNGRFGKETALVRSNEATNIFALAIRSGHLLLALRYAKYIHPEHFQKLYLRILARAIRWISRKLALRVDINSRLLQKVAV